MTFSVIIINYRQKDLLSECLESLYSVVKSADFEVIVVNSSPEEDLSYLESRYSGLKILVSDNRGYSAANNKAAEIAKGAYLFFLNADTLIKSDFFGLFAESFKDTEFGAAGLKLTHPDGTFQLSCYRENTISGEIRNKRAEKKFNDKNSEFILRIEKQYSSITETDWVSGAAMILRKKVFTEIGGFSTSYFLFYEDADICKRLRKAGYRNYFFPSAAVVHYKGENVNPDFKSDTYFYSKKSQLIYYRKHNGIIQRVILRVYLFVKFFFLSVFTFKNIYFKVLKLVLGGRL